MKIIIFEGVASSKWGGAERSMREFCVFLSSLGHDVLLVYEKGGDYIELPLSSIYKKHIHIDLSPLGAVNPIKWTNSIFTLLRFVFINKVDIIFTHTIHAYPILRIVKIFTRVKIITYFKWIYNSPSVGFQARWGVKCIDKAHAVSNFVVQYWSQNGVHFDKSAIIPDGIHSPKSFLAMEVNKSNVKLLFLGRIYYGKGLHVLIEAISRCKITDFTLSVGGSFKDTKYKNEITQLIELHGLVERIKFLGFVEDTNKLISEHSIIVVPSILPEAQPLVILEAMAQRRLVIATNVGGNSEILSGELDTLLFEPDSHSCSVALEKIMTYTVEKRNNLVESLRKRFEENYTIDLTHKMLLNSLMQSGKGY